MTAWHAKVMTNTFTLASGESFKCEAGGVARHKSPNFPERFDLTCTPSNGGPPITLHVVDTADGIAVVQSSGTDELARNAKAAILGVGVQIGDSIIRTCPTCGHLASSSSAKTMMCAKGHVF